ncbi:hypothetical protein [Corynebacterium sp. AOP40-4SA-5]|uniref:hypothetical protein n=1 Tax=Corynebacterium sp. AOP40-4SA-5 TaxID=3457678 RepID=UPI0040331DF3
MTDSHNFQNAPLKGMNWDEYEVPDGYVDVTFRLPETGLGFHGRMTADITIKEAPNA